MLEAAFWGFVGGFSLLAGAVAALVLPVSQRVIGLIMGFGAGVLISAVAFELTEEAFAGGGADAVTIGLAAGALTFFAGDRIIERRGGGDRKRSGGQQADGSPKAIVLGAVLDGIPESAAIGISLLGPTGGVSAALVGAVFLSNVPESLSSTTGLTKAGHSRGYALGVWAIVVVASTAASVLGYALLGGASEDVVAIIQSFAAGAILTMLADTMIPEAFDSTHRNPMVGLFTVLGFAAAFLLSTLE